MHWVLAITNACNAVRWVTRFSCDIFGWVMGENVFLKHQSTDTRIKLLRGDSLHSKRHPGSHAPMASQ